MRVGFGPQPGGPAPCSPRACPPAFDSTVSGPSSHSAEPQGKRSRGEGLDPSALRPSLAPSPGAWPPGPAPGRSCASSSAATQALRRGETFLSLCSLSTLDLAACCAFRVALPSPRPGRACAASQTCGDSSLPLTLVQKFCFS